MTHEAAIAAPSRAGQTLPVRLGVIDYLNCVPVYDWLLRQMAERSMPGIETEAGTPAQMNRALLSGAIDISNVSSVAYGSRPWRPCGCCRRGARRRCRAWCRSRPAR